MSLSKENTNNTYSIHWAYEEWHHNECVNITKDQLNEIGAENKRKKWKRGRYLRNWIRNKMKTK